MLEEPFFFFSFHIAQTESYHFHKQKTAKASSYKLFFSDEESEPATVQMKTQKKVYVVT